jgi:YbgC/YbaW family acyl-CoA thioester hydrolase
MSFEFVQQRRIEFSETDMAGIVHFANFFRWMESAEHAFLRSLGFSVHGVTSGKSTGWPRVKVGCEYSKPLRFEEVVDVVLTVKEVRTRSVQYGFEFRKVTSGEVVATGETVAVHAVLDTAQGQLAASPIPETLRTLLIERLKG